MVYGGYFGFESIGAVSFAIGMLVFVIAYTALAKMLGKKNKGAAVIASLIVGLFAGWKFYTSDLFYETEVMGAVMFLTVIVIVFLILTPFIRFFRRKRR